MCGLTNQQKCAMLVNKQSPLHQHHTDSILSCYNGAAPVYDTVSFVIFNNGVNIVRLKLRVLLLCSVHDVIWEENVLGRKKSTEPC